MHLKIEDIIKEIKDDLNLSTTEIERMIDSQFLLVEDTIKSRSGKTVNLIYIGKFRPTSWFKRNKDMLLSKYTKEEYENIKKARRNYTRVEKSNIE